MMGFYGFLTVLAWTAAFALGIVALRAADPWLEILAGLEWGVAVFCTFAFGFLCGRDL